MNARSELSIAGVLIAFCLLNYFYLIPTQVVAEGSSPVYPLLINTMLLCFSLAYLWEGFRALKQEKRQAAEDGEQPPASKAIMWRPLAVLVVTGAWILTMEWLGFILSTFLFLLIASRLFGSKNWGKGLALSVAMPLVIYIVFRLLNSILPTGPVEELIEKFI